MKSGGVERLRKFLQESDGRYTDVIQQDDGHVDSTLQEYSGELLCNVQERELGISNCSLYVDKMAIIGFI